MYALKAAKELVKEGQIITLVVSNIEWLQLRTPNFDVLGLEYIRQLLLSLFRAVDKLGDQACGFPLGVPQSYGYW